MVERVDKKNSFKEKKILKGVSQKSVFRGVKNKTKKFQFRHFSSYWCWFHIIYIFYIYRYIFKIFFSIFDFYNFYLSFLSVFYGFLKFFRHIFSFFQFFKYFLNNFLNSSVVFYVFLSQKCVWCNRKCAERNQ